MGREYHIYRWLCPRYSRASPKADVSAYEEDAERDGWEPVRVDEQVLGIQTSAIEEKCQVFETPIVCCLTLSARFEPSNP
ncbi:hypothetical protein BDN72DRAFT_903130 [Pluteus cervinus]|uniref:Uncharacterized protein n=1 Tax=Pluteus cervinus TaxID=181527 RepID=A0ACD3A9K2_9AGAR|nr:hypothetical protein BDN72DRAFT_903130 [Pluteus cervinus]